MGYIMGNKVNIKYMEVDKDHIHYMIEIRPNINLADFVRIMKSYTAYHIRKNIPIISVSNFGKRERFGLTVASYVPSAM